MPVHENKVTALIGPSGCGKSTFLRCFNRMHDLYPGNRYEGEIMLYPDNINLLGRDVDPIEVRMRISMVFQKPNPFPKSIFENVAYGLRVRGEQVAQLLDEKVEEALRGAALWDEVKDRLRRARRSTSPAASSSGCASRARWRPIRRSCCSTSRPRRSTRSRPASIEELITDLKQQGDDPDRHAQHAAGGARLRLHRLHVPRRADRVRRDRRRSSSSRSSKQTEDYITGRFG